jgi:hypothetical protein
VVPQACAQGPAKTVTSDPGGRALPPLAQGFWTLEVPVFRLKFLQKACCLTPARHPYVCAGRRALPVSGHSGRALCRGLESAGSCYCPSLKLSMVLLLTDLMVIQCIYYSTTQACCPGRTGVGSTLLPHFRIGQLLAWVLARISEA